jgi:hypothetical protein
MKRFLWLGFVLFLYLICTGCGDTFRPIIIPNPPVFPNPQASHTVVSINDNETCSNQNPCNSFVPVAGSAMVIDVSGDTDVSTVNAGIAPVHAVQQTASQVLVVNQAITGYAPPVGGGCLITQTYPNPVLNVCPSITKLTYSGTVISSTATITLPVSSAANFVATAESAQAYVSLPNYIPDPINNPTVVVPSIEVVNTTANNLVTTIPVGNNPIAMAETPDGKKLYVANEGDSTISGFNTVDRSQRVGSPTGTSSPHIWLLARSDSQQVYALEATTGTLAWLNTTSTAGPDTLIETPISVPNATKMVYDPNLNRLYIPGGSQVAMVDVSQSAPSTIVSNIPITPIQPASRSASDPCSTTAITTLNTIDVAALPDGTRVYVGSYYEDAVNNVEYICPQVTVINAVSNTVETPTIAIPGFTANDAFCSPSQSSRAPRFRIMMAAGGDSTRAYLSSCDGGMVNIIDTSSDTYDLNLPAPVGSSPPIPPSLQNPPQNPVFLLAGP